MQDILNQLEQEYYYVKYKTDKVSKALARQLEEIIQMLIVYRRNNV